MNVKVTVKLDNEKLNNITKAHMKSLEMTGDELLGNIKTSQVVPRNDGTLENSGFVDTTGINWGYTRIIFDTPYARRLYWHPEYNFRRGEGAPNPNAQGKWMDAYINGEKDDFMKNAYSKFLKMNLKGVIK